MSTEVTVKREEYRLSLKALNLGASMLHRLGFSLGKISEASLLAGARRATGLEDWGGEHFLEPFRVMLDDVERAGLTSLARISTRDIGLHCLTNRLKLTDYLKRHPHVGSHPIKRPVFILGFPFQACLLTRLGRSRPPACVMALADRNTLHILVNFTLYLFFFLG